MTEELEREQAGNGGNRRALVLAAYARIARDGSTNFMRLGA